MKYVKIIYAGIKAIISIIKERYNFNKILSSRDKNDLVDKMVMEICNVISKYTRFSPFEIYNKIQKKSNSDGSISIDIDFK